MKKAGFNPALVAGLAAFGGVAIALHAPHLPVKPACLAGLALAYLGWAALHAIFGRQDMPLAWFMLVPMLLVPTFLAAIGGFMAGRLLARMAAARHEGA